MSINKAWLNIEFVDFIFVVSSRCKVKCVVLYLVVVVVQRLDADGELAGGVGSGGKCMDPQMVGRWYPQTTDHRH